MANVAVKLRYARIAPRKARLVVDMIRGKSVAWAESQLGASTKGAALPILKLLRSGMAAAKEKRLTEQGLTIRTALVQEGPRLKRAVPHFRGTIRPIDKQLSHITLVLSDEGVKNGSEKSGKKKYYTGSRMAAHGSPQGGSHGQ
jgi:large subunit ribosomal protein L22